MSGKVKKLGTIQIEFLMYVRKYQRNSLSLAARVAVDDGLESGMYIDNGKRATTFNQLKSWYGIAFDEHNKNK